MTTKYLISTAALLVTMHFKLASQTEISNKNHTPLIVKEIPIDSVWAANGVRFDMQTVGNMQFVAYFDKNRMMTLASRKLGSDVWTKKTLPNQLMWDSHNSVQLGIDPMGYIHVSGNMHVHPLAYFRSTKPYDISTMKAFNKMLGKDEEQVTYPKFFYDKKGNLLFSYRSGTCGNGNILVNRYHPRKGEWERYLDQPLFEGIEENDDRAAYHHWVKDSKGNFHFAWIWRWTPMVETSHHICYATTPNMKKWKDASGQSVALPFRPNDPQVLVDATPSKGGMHNSRYKLILTPNDEPIIGYVKYDEKGLTQLYLARFKNGKWLSKKISDWNFRWKFITTGAFMSIGGQFNFVGISDDGLLAIDWQTEKGDEGSYIIDIETLEHSRKASHVRPQYPLELHKKMSDNPKLKVRVAYDKSESNKTEHRYVMKWEAAHGGFSQDAPERIPDGPLSPLILLEIK